MEIDFSVKPRSKSQLQTSDRAVCFARASRLKNSLTHQKARKQHRIGVLVWTVGPFGPDSPVTTLESVVIFFSLTEAPLPDPAPTPPNTPKRTRNGPETEPNGAETEPKRSQTEPKRTEIEPSRVGRPGGLSGWRGVGGL